MRTVLGLILAGGKGSRLEPLTVDRAKPAVPFGGIYRIIDFTLSNCINSGLRRILVLTQFKSRSLDRHIRAEEEILFPAFQPVYQPYQVLAERPLVGPLLPRDVQAQARGEVMGFAEHRAQRFDTGRCAGVFRV